VLSRAHHLPLEELQIVNFRGFIPAIPERIGQFQGLTKLTLFNNSLRALPAAIGNLGALTTLLVDANPIASILPSVQKLSGLKILGIAKTRVPTDETARIRMMLPQCKVITQ
jgi:Leucine-rich repeat (LRR) protein